MEAKIAALDEPFRSHLREMIRKPPLTQEQQVESFSRIEKADFALRVQVNRFGSTARACLTFANELRKGRRRFEHFALPSKIESRERYMEELPELCAELESASNQCAAAYTIWVSRGQETRDSASTKEEFEKARDAVRRIFPRFCLRKAIIANFECEADLCCRQIRLLRDSAGKFDEQSAESGVGNCECEEKIREIQMRVWMSPEECITESEKLKLCRKMEQEAEAEITEDNVRLVLSVASEYTDRGLPFLDLIRSGNRAVIRAIENFDYNRGYRFASYAKWWIRQAVTQSIAEALTPRASTG